MFDKLANIENRIEQLKKKKTKLQTQQAVLFTKEAEKIFENSFSPEIALAVLAEWKTATELKKKEWTIRSHSFRIQPLQIDRAKTETSHPILDKK